MTGKQLFEKHTDAGGEYAQTLFTALMAVGYAELFNALEAAEKEGKKVSLVELPENILGEPTEIELV